MPDPIRPSLDDRGLPADYPLDDVREITPRQLKAKLDAAEAVHLIDCRLPAEREVTAIEPSALVPLQQLAERFDREVAPHRDEEVVVYCRSGVRSLTFVDALRRAGFERARSLAGGINLWNSDVADGPTY